MPWQEINNSDELNKLLENFFNFQEAEIVDIKYFSADRTNPEYPGDTSYENAIYASFMSNQPDLAYTNEKNIILKFTGINHLNIKSDKGDVGKLNGCTFTIVDDQIVWSTDPNFVNLLPVDNTPLNQLPTFILADSVAWGYGLPERND